MVNWNSRMDNVWIWCGCRVVCSIILLSKFLCLV